MKSITFLFFSFLIVTNGYSQQRFATGLIMDEKSYDAMPRKARLTDKAYDSAPSQASLKSYCPEVGDQGANGTCVGWSTAWAMRTIIEAKQKNVTNRSDITKFAFSPAFNYYYSTNREAFSCGTGAKIPVAVNSMVERGVPLYVDFPENCSSSIPAGIREKAKEYKLKDANRLFDGDALNHVKVSTVKTALTNGNPVAFGMLLPSSFYSAKGCWVPNQGERPEGGHAMCVVGFDDNKYGGAFEIMNSWGSDWGNDGFMWLKYNDFANFTKYAFEAYPENPTPPQGTTISGTIKLVANDGSELAVGKNKGLNLKAQTVVGDVAIGDYVVTKGLTSGSRYRLYITANQAVYVYVISSDLNNTAGQLFPISNESPFLSYSDNEVALPNEKSWIQLDNTVGTDFTCVVYSTKELSIDDIMAKIKSAPGSFVEKVNVALGSDLIPQSAMTTSPDKIRFNAKADSQTAAAIIIEINHL